MQTNWQASLPWFEDEAQRIRSKRYKGDRSKMERRELKELMDFMGHCPLDLLIHDSNEIFLEQLASISRRSAKGIHF